MSTEDHGRYALALGEAVIAEWGDLPRDVQERLFEAALALGRQSERDESLREQMAKFLHDHHKRTLQDGS